MPLPHLSAADLDALDLSPAEIRDALADTIRARAAGLVHAAPKTMLKPGDKPASTAYSYTRSR